MLWASGQTPDEVRKFRQSILTLRKDPNLGNMLFDRKDRVYSAVLPGYDGASWKNVHQGLGTTPTRPDHLLTLRTFLPVTRYTTGQARQAFFDPLG